MKRIARNQRGFTLIEIIMVIVLLGIIAAVAVPKYVDLREQAADATAEGIVGAMVSSAAIGYADLITKGSSNTFPAFTTLHNSYLQVQNVTLYPDTGNSFWTATVGGDIYTFTYAQDGSVVGWD